MNSKIDICRGLFAYLVVVAHGMDLTRAIHGEAIAALSPTTRDLVSYAFGKGIHWVMGFFVISGYCIHLSVARLSESEHFPLKTYLVARVSRILPLYYLGLLFAIAAEWVVSGARPFCWAGGVDGPTLVLQLFVVQNLTQTYGSFASTWSITNELFYYIFYGLLACVGLRLRWRPAVIGMLICLAVGLLTHFLYTGAIRSPYVYSTGMLFGLGINWFLGALVAEYRDTYVRSRWARVLSRFWLPILAVGVYWHYDHLAPAGMYMIPGVAFVLMLVRFLNAEEPGPRPAERTRMTGFIEMLGLSSYPTYLFHGPLLILLGSAIMRWRLIEDWRVTWLVLSVVGIGAGIALGYLAEAPIMAWRRGLLRRMKEADGRESRRAGTPPVGVPG